MSSLNQPILQCHDLSQRFSEGSRTVEVFKSINFSVSPGECIGILGVSGAGKSTFLHLLGGLDKPTSGQVVLAGHNMSHITEHVKSRLRNQHLGFVYQFHHLLPEFNALENVCMPLWVRGLSRKLAKEKAIELIEQVGLSERMLHRISELSGGERQRIAIARALVTEPSCVLADEPTGNLDSETAQSVFRLMLDLNQTLKTSFVIVTHNKSLTSEMNRSLLLQDGQLMDYAAGDVP